MAIVYARRLREAGFSEQQAEGQAEALAAAMTDTLATRQDLQELDVRMGARFAATKQDLQELDVRMDARFAATKQDLHELELRMDSRFARVDASFDQVDRRFEYLEKHFDIRFDEQEKRFRMFVGEQIADLDRRMMVRMLVGIGAVSALVKLL